MGITKLNDSQRNRLRWELWAWFKKNGTYKDNDMRVRRQDIPDKLQRVIDYMIEQGILLRTYDRPRTFTGKQKICYLKLVTKCNLTDRPIKVGKVVWKSFSVGLDRPLGSPQLFNEQGLPDLPKIPLKNPFDEPPHIRPVNDIGWWENPFEIMQERINSMRQALGPDCADALIESAKREWIANNGLNNFKYPSAEDRQREQEAYLQRVANELIRRQLDNAS
jgi:hypothetical protein